MLCMCWEEWVYCTKWGFCNDLQIKGGKNTSQMNSKRKQYRKTMSSYKKSWELSEHKAVIHKLDVPGTKHGHTFICLEHSLLKLYIKILMPCSLSHLPPLLQSCWNFLWLVHLQNNWLDYALQATGVLPWLL